MLDTPDGFLYNTLLRDNMTYLAFCLRNYDALRGVKNYRSRTWVIPENTLNQTLNPWNSFEYQVPMPPGSIIWGWTWANGNSGGVVANFSFSFADSCNDARFASEVISTSRSAGKNSLYSNTGLNPGQGKQNPLPKPLVIGPPGLLNVNISAMDINTPLATNISNVQLILWGGEPVRENDAC